MDNNKILDGLHLLRQPFAENQISHLPKPTKAQTDAPYNEKINCQLCGAFHHPKVVHLDYVGHAGVTNRLLEADINWNWRPVAFDSYGLPLRDEIGGLWIILSVNGVERLGYGDAQGKIGNNAVKELIGDAIRNAAIRFGVALELWSKSDLDAEEPESTITLLQSQALADHCAFCKVAPEVPCAVYNIRSLSELPESKYAECFERIAARGKAQDAKKEQPKQQIL